MIKGFIFDMDGVITSSSDEHFEAWGKIMADKGYTVAPETEKLTRGVSRMESLEAILNSLNIADKYTLEEKQEMARIKNDMYVSLIEQFTPARLYPNVLNILKELKEKGYKIGLGSASKNGPLLLNRLEIEQYFDFVADVSKGLASKPAPDIFLAAAKGLHLDPVECVGVEDAIAGVAAIKNANMFAVGIGDSEQLNQAEIVYPSMTDFKLDEIINLAKNI